MTKQLRISEEAYEFLQDEAEQHHRRIIGDQVDALIDELKDWRVGATYIDPTPTSFDNRSAKEIMADMKPEDVPESWRTSPESPMQLDMPSPLFNGKRNYGELQKKKTK